MVKLLRDRVIRRAGFDFFPYVAQIIGEPWTVNPVGFKFQCSDPKRLRGSLLRGPRFGLDRAQKDSIRELSQPDSVHFSIPLSGACVVHLDSISIVELTKDHAGFVVYKDLPTILRHIAVDKYDIDQGPIESPLDGRRGTEF